MTGTTVAPAAGWYADPADAAGQRWWDGGGWTAHVRPVTPPPNPDPRPAPSLPPQSAVEPQPQFGSLAWRDRAAAGTASAGGRPVSMTAHGSLPNHEATRALISGGALVALLVVNVVLRLPIYLTVTGMLVAIVLGILGLRRWRTTATGLKRSLAGLSIGAIMGLLALIGVVVVPGFQQAVAYSTNLEQAIVDTSNSLDMPALAVDATCPTRAAVPPLGTVLTCSLSLEDGSRYEVTVTVSSADGSSTIVIRLPAG